MLVFTNRPTNGNIYSLHSNIRIPETVDVTNTGLLILAEIRRGELITQMAVLKMHDFLGWNVDLGFRQWRI